MLRAPPLFIRHRLDFDRSHFLAAVRALVHSSSWDSAARRAELAYSASEDVVACLCVRSGFDLLLQALALPRGSEVLVTALTIPDMVRVLELHGLVPVPVDLDVATLAPSLDALERAVGQRTRALLVAHLFGGRLEMGAIASWARQRNLLVIEDAAQAVTRVDAGSTHADADATLWSFGPLKTATALGGGILRLPDARLRQRVRAIQAAWPVQSRSVFRGRLAKIGFLAAVQDPQRARTGSSLAIRLGFATSLDDLIRRGTRSFKPATHAELARLLRARPSIPMLRLLAHRLATLDTAAIERRARAGEATLRALGASVPVLGARQLERTHWLFGVEQDDPEATLARLAEIGVDASWRLENLCVVAPPAGGSPAVRAKSALGRTVFVPVYPSMDDATRARTVDVLREGARAAVRRPEEQARCAR